MTDICNTCRLKQIREHSKPIIPDLKEPKRILFLTDFPLEEDFEYGLVLSGLHRRARFIHKLMKDIKMEQDDVSHATVMRCITKSKSIININDYKHCGQLLLEEIRENRFKAVLCFGSVAGSLIKGNSIKSIERSRGQVHESIIPGTFCVITYAIGMITDSTGCGGCNSNIYPMLARKDAQLIMKELKRRKNTEKKTKAHKKKN